MTDKEEVKVQPTEDDNIDKFQTDLDAVILKMGITEDDIVKLLKKAQREVRGADDDEEQEPANPGDS